MKKLITTAALLLALAAPAAAQSQSKPVELGYNALEVLGTTEGGARVRSLANLDANIGPVSPGFHGLNEVTFKQGERTLDTYFGRNAFTLGIGDSKVVPVVVLKTSSGVTDAKYGIRHTSPPLCDYGFLDAGLGKDGGTLDMFCGKEAGRFTMEVFNSTKMPYHERASNYLELQPYLKLGRGYSLTARAEVDGKDFRKGRYLFGGVKKF